MVRFLFVEFLFENDPFTVTYNLLKALVLVILIFERLLHDTNAVFFCDVDMYIFMLLLGVDIPTCSKL